MQTNKTTISFEYGNQQYTLGFTPRTIKAMEQNGFNFAKIEDKMLSAPEELFCGAFLEKHPMTPRKLRLEIYHELTENAEDGENLMDVLEAMIAEAIDALSTHTGNLKWSVNK